MCYTGKCPNENSMGECKLPDYECPIPDIDENEDEDIECELCKERINNLKIIKDYLEFENNQLRSLLISAQKDIGFLKANIANLERKIYKLISKGGNLK